MISLLFSRLRCALNPDLAHIIELQAELRHMLAVDSPPVVEVADFLDSLDHRSRLAVLRSLGPAHQRRLFDAVDGFRPVTIDDVVPPSVGARETVRHHGKNTLPLMTTFEKRFMRPSEDADVLWGYNHQFAAPVTGPGYFVARNAEGRPEVDIDYTVVPPEQPSGWPRLQENTEGLGNFVYAHMVDRLRGVTAEVSIGRAFKRGRVMDAWFLLCRE